MHEFMWKNLKMVDQSVGTYAVFIREKEEEGRGGEVNKV